MKINTYSFEVNFVHGEIYKPSKSGPYLVYMNYNDNTVHCPYYICDYDKENNEWYDDEGSIIDKEDEKFLYWAKLPEKLI